MDPVTALVSAMALGATAALKDTASDAIREAYHGLKGLVLRKFGFHPSVEALEKAPASANKRASAAEDLVDAAADLEVVSAATALSKLVKQEDPDAARLVGVDLDRLVAAFLTIDGVTSSGDGIRGRDWKLEAGVSISNVVAGVRDPRP